MWSVHAEEHNKLRFIRRFALMAFFVKGKCGCLFSTSGRAKLYKSLRFEVGWLEMARILIVEDDPINAELASVICRTANHLVMVAENGAEALMLLDMEAFDLVLADVIMPRMDGITMTEMIRSSGAPYANVPIVGLTAKADAAGQAAMREAGMDDVVTKPFTNFTLKSALVKWLGHGRHSVTIFRPSLHDRTDRLDA